MSVLNVFKKLSFILLKIVWYLHLSKVVYRFTLRPLRVFRMSVSRLTGWSRRFVKEHPGCNLVHKLSWSRCNQRHWRCQHFWSICYLYLSDDGVHFAVKSFQIEAQFVFPWGDLSGEAGSSMVFPLNLFLACQARMTIRSSSGDYKS